MSEYLQRKQPSVLGPRQSSQESPAQNTAALMRQMKARVEAYNRMRAEEDEQKETTEEQTLYFVTNDNAVIREDKEPHDGENGVIPQGIRVNVIDTFKKRSRVQYVSNPETKKWTSTSNISEVKSVTDTNYYTAFYNDIEVFEFPGAIESNAKLKANTEYQLTNSSHVADEDMNTVFHKVVEKDKEEAVGWVADYKNVLYGKDTMTRQKNLKAFETWLETKLAEARGLEGDAQIEFVQRVLSLVETESVKIANKKYSDKDELTTAFNAIKSVNTDQGATLPHELIEVVRKFINITEFKVEEKKEPKKEPDQVIAENTKTTESGPNASAEPKENTKSEKTTEPVKTEEPAKTTETVVGGSRHSSIDWNSRLGVPQYRTQSDNLSAPEVTCNVTTMAMALERLGNSRQDVIAAIETKLKDGEEKTGDEVKTLWEEKSEAYMKKITSEADADYKKLRQNSGGLVGKEKDISKKYKTIAQLEDLLDFYMYLKTDKPKDRELIFSNTYNDSIPEEINPSNANEYSTERIDISEKLNAENRNKIKQTLDNGGSVVVSVNHKGTKGSHIINVQSISDKGLIVDDPYGGHASEYRYGETGDLFAGKNKGPSDRRSNGEPYRNTKHFDSVKDDYSERDFTAEAAQNLEIDESKGNSILIKWEMINESKVLKNKSFISYVVLYQKN